MADKQPKYKTEIQQMMFVSGETIEPATETTTLVEQIVQDQVQHMLREGTSLANRRGQRNITVDDLMFLHRHNKAKLSRLRHFLTWKDVRKNVKDNDGGPEAGTGDIAGGEELGGVGIGPGAGPQEMKKAKKNRVELPWDVHSFFHVQVPPRDDEDDEEEEEMNQATLQRLKYADERTRNMSREDYMHWSECRQASFTFRKGKRFREWAGFGAITDSKPNDDIIDILGFLTFEIVQTLTEESLKVKAAEDLWKKKDGAAASKENGTEGGTMKRKRERGLFDLPEEERDPIQPAHVREAYRLLQQPEKKYRALILSARQPIRRPLRLI